MRYRLSLSTAGVLVLVLLAGCSVTTPGGAATATSTVEAPTPGGGNASRASPDWDPTNQTRFSNLSIGREADLPDGEAPHEYLVWNTAPTERRIVITVWRDGSLVRNESVGFPGHGVLKLTVHEPGAYRIVVAPTGGERLVTRPHAFDCNFRTWEIAVHPDGTVDSQVLQTLVACATETG